MEAELRYLDESGTAVNLILGNVDGTAVVRGRPVRTFPSYRGQRNYPGLFWCATTRSLVGYESLLERDRLWPAAPAAVLCALGSCTAPSRWTWRPSTVGALPSPGWCSARQTRSLPAV